MAVSVLGGFFYSTRIIRVYVLLVPSFFLRQVAEREAAFCRGSPTSPNLTRLPFEGLMTLSGTRTTLLWRK